VVLVLSGVYVYHQRKRPILPSSGKVPPPIAEALTAAARRVIARAL
jgi:hypothetical protein